MWACVSTFTFSASFSSGPSQSLHLCLVYTHAHTHTHTHANARTHTGTGNLRDPFNSSLFLFSDLEHGGFPPQPGPTLSAQHHFPQPSRAPILTFSPKSTQVASCTGAREVGAARPRPGAWCGRGRTQHWGRALSTVITPISLAAPPLHIRHCFVGHAVARTEEAAVPGRGGGRALYSSLHCQ